MGRKRYTPEQIIRLLRQSDQHSLLYLIPVPDMPLPRKAILPRGCTASLYSAGNGQANT